MKPIVVVPCKEAYNIEHNITPKSVSKDVKELIELTKIEEDMVTEERDFHRKKENKKNPQRAWTMDTNHMFKIHQHLRWQI